MQALLLLYLFLQPYKTPLQDQPAVRIPGSHIEIRLPDSNWHMAVVDTAKGLTIFKRNAVVDPEGQGIILAIMFVVEDARPYHGNVVEFSIAKRQPFTKTGVRVDTTLIESDKGYPLTCIDAMFMKCSYEADGVAHRLYMIHIIDKYDEAIQVYLDMTKDLGKKYDDEFMTAIRSIKEN